MGGVEGKVIPLVVRDFDVSALHLRNPRNGGMEWNGRRGFQGERETEERWGFLGLEMGKPAIFYGREFIRKRERDAIVLRLRLDLGLG